MKLLGMKILDGRALRRVREKYSATQDDVARAARRAGLRWTRASVAALESDRRDLSLDELRRLALVLHHLTGRSHVVRLSADENESDVTIDGETWRRDLGTKWKATLDVMRENDRALRVWPEARREDLEAAHVDKGGEAEAKAARRFRVSTLTLALAARKTWTRSLSAERDRRVAAEAPPDASARTLQALRGHVTRQLLAELEPVVRTAAGRRRK